MSKHEWVPCERCHQAIECKSNAFTRCDCASIYLTVNEVQWISEQYEGCLCNACLKNLQQEYQQLKAENNIQK